MNQFQKLRPLVQLVPAAAVAAVVLATLPRTAPVLAAVPERLAAPEPAPSEAAQPEETAPEEESIPRLPYADGVYTGSSRGYGGQVKVQVTMKDGLITEVQILDASHETKQFLRRASRLLDTVQAEQTWEVDAVSEATYTSRGILGAVQNALTGEEVINPAPPQPKPAQPLVVEEFTAPSAYRDGVYTASAQGFGGPITLQVTIQNDTIADITIVSAEGETQPYFSRARRVISTILEGNTPEVDSISGATYSSTGILNAVKSALSSAAIQTEPPAEEAPAEETPAEPAAPQYQDGTYTGTSGSTTVSVTITDGSVTEVAVLPPEEEKQSLWQRAKAAVKAVLSEEPGKNEATFSAADNTAVDAAVQDALLQAVPQSAEADSSAETEAPAEPEAAPADPAAASETAE